MVLFKLCYFKMRQIQISPWFLLFGSKQRLKSFNTTSVQINEWRTLERESSLKYLGVILDEDMSLSDHIENLIRKSNQRLGLLKRIKHLLPFDARQHYIYLSHSFCPYSTMQVILYGETRTMLLLQVQQCKAAKIILKKPIFSSRLLRLLAPWSGRGQAIAEDMHIDVSLFLKV